MISGHLASFTVALKAGLRGTKDLDNLRGLLSSCDNERIQCSSSMSAHFCGRGAWRLPHGLDALRGGSEQDGEAYVVVFFIFSLISKSWKIWR